ncbi:DUF2202 domain-containing protein [uncultured Lutibacter sp.]|uniref:DUF2202 domain-containing protein n=1 Tax=uncultured Lutibacter sp. TaxID=437739 RepID=UPI00260FF645|nr:DUF2202 domain-containing protein [uncultured Lutibacter sp.]
MRKMILVTVIVFLAITVGCTNDNNENSIIDIVLTQDEINDLLFLREEEKLARDVYLYSYDKYGTIVFNNIASSESSHMNSVLILLNKYNIEDPILENRGEFRNTTLQKIYNDLIELSDISLLEALRVGNIIEDMDIKDLTLNESRTEKIDLLSLYDFLKCGSQNHLRNFNNQLISNGGNYVPEYLTQIAFETIVNSTNEWCGFN